MRGFRKFAKLLPLIIVFLIILGLGGAFLLRPPVLVVTDISFTLLYGPVRQRLKEIETSLRMFRRVIPVPVVESAGPDLVTLAAEGASRSPFAVLFPYRYLEGARHYKESHPEAQVLVMGGRNPRPGDEAALTFVCTDTVQDLYRAGLCAALFSGENSGVLFFYDGVLSEEYRGAFREGLLAKGFAEEPVFVNASVDYSSYSGYGCIVVAGPAAKFLERNLKIPVILFSWTDPAMTPSAVKLVFDDSPLALTMEALGALPSGGEIFVPSAPVVIQDRIVEKMEYRNIQELIKEKFEKK